MTAAQIVIALYYIVRISGSYSPQRKHKSCTISAIKYATWIAIRNLDPNDLPRSTLKSFARFAWPSKKSFSSCHTRTRYEKRNTKSGISARTKIVCFLGS